MNFFPIGVGDEVCWGDKGAGNVGTVTEVNGDWITFKYGPYNDEMTLSRAKLRPYVHGIQ